MTRGVIKCPGEHNSGRVVPQQYRCPKCGAVVEIWTDETQRRCTCGKLVIKAEAKPM